ncbi:MAG: acyl-CoA dehydratase activase [Desulfobacterales bacterium]|jgi:predicted CoA-substrate-specific enzyme activase|nr:acyl-CoA dehydratase activase [Desulfobacterales bacterium]
MWAGIDIGSLSAEAVIMNSEKILSYAILPTGGNSIKIAEKVFQKAVSFIKNVSESDIKYVVATGYGRVIVPFADKNITEITCHAKGIHYLHPSVRTILDMGGQDCKAIRCDESGKVINFVMNDKCAAGTGRSLEIVAHVLGVELEDLGGMSLGASKESKISSRCAVFAKSEVLSLNRAGVPKNEIVAGVHDAITDNVLELVSRVEIEEDFAITGGVAKNKGIVKKIEEKTGLRLIIPFEPQIIGALGAALFAREASLQAYMLD